MAQNAKNHLRFFPPFHFFAIPLTVIGLGLSIYQAIINPSLLCWLITLLFLLMAFANLFARTFSLKSQDRAIRTDEKLRYFILTGKPLPAALTSHQIIALRFASDEELVALAERAVGENLSSKEIKKTVLNWRADNYRI